MSRRKGLQCFPRERRALTLAFAAAVAVGCSDGRGENVLAALGLIDPATEPPERVAVLCDHSAGSACSPEALERVIEATLLHLTERPGSAIALYELGPTVADTRLVRTESIPASTAVRPREIEGFRKQQVAQIRTALLEDAHPYLSRGPVRSSPLLESITKIAALEPGAHHLVIVSDALEESRLGHWECGPLPDSATLATTLRQEHLLPKGSLRGSVMFSFRTLAGVDRNRCPLNFMRIAEIEALWTGALRAAGATRVSFAAGPPDFAMDHATHEHGAAEAAHR
jgi:hypothetical protein